MAGDIQGEIAREIQYFEKKIVAWNGRIGLWILSGHGRFRLDQPWSIVQLRIVHSIMADRFPMLPRRDFARGYTRVFPLKGHDEMLERIRSREREFQFLQRERLSEICYSIVEDRPVIRHCYGMIYNIRDTLFGELWKCMVYDSCISSFLRIIIIYEYRRWRKEMEFIYRKWTLTMCRFFSFSYIFTIPLYPYIYPYELKIIFGIIIKFNNFSNNLVFSKQSFFFSLISNHTFFHKKGRISFETPH